MYYSEDVQRRKDAGRDAAAPCGRYRCCGRLAGAGSQKGMSGIGRDLLPKETQAFRNAMDVHIYP